MAKAMFTPGSLRERHPETNLIINRRIDPRIAHHNVGQVIDDESGIPKGWEGTVFEDCEFDNAKIKAKTLILNGIVSGDTVVNDSEVVNLNLAPARGGSRSTLRVVKTSVDGGDVDILSAGPGSTIKNVRAVELNTPASMRAEEPPVIRDSTFMAAKLNRCVVSGLKIEDTLVIGDDATIEGPVEANRVIIEGRSLVTGNDIGLHHIESDIWIVESHGGNTFDELSRVEDRSWVVIDQTDRYSTPLHPRRNVLIMQPKDYGSPVGERRAEIAKRLMVRDDNLRVDGRNRAAWEFIFDALGDEHTGARSRDVDDETVFIALTMHQNPED